jgi:hypothetical protein
MALFNTIDNSVLKCIGNTVKTYKFVVRRIFVCGIITKTVI